MRWLLGALRLATAFRFGLIAVTIAWNFVSLDLRVVSGCCGLANAGRVTSPSVPTKIEQPTRNMRCNLPTWHPWVLEPGMAGEQSSRRFCLMELESYRRYLVEENAIEGTLLGDVDLVEHQVDDNTRNGDVHPDGPSPLDDFSVGSASILHSGPDGSDRQEGDGHGQKDVGT